MKKGFCATYTTSGNAVDALSEKIEVSMYDLAGLARIADAFLACGCRMQDIKNGNVK